MATTSTADHTSPADEKSNGDYGLAESIGYLAVSEKHKTAAPLVGALALLWSGINVILAVFLIVPILFVKSSINRVTQWDKNFDQANPGFWNPFDNILFNGVILLMGPVAVILLSMCYQWIAKRWNMVKAILVYILMVGALTLEGFRVAYLVNDLLHHREEWDNATYTIAYVFCSAEALFALLFIVGVKRIISRERVSSKIRDVANKPSHV